VSSIHCIAKLQAGFLLLVTIATRTITRTRKTGTNASTVGTQSIGTRVLCILLVDDHEHVCQGLQSLLEGQPGWTICDETTDREAIALTEQPPTDVIVIDIHMPRMEELPAAREIAAATPQIKVVVLTPDETKEVVQVAKEVRARGIVMKSGAVRELVTGVAALAGHEPFYTQKASQILLQDPAHYLNALPAHPVKPTRREREVVILAAERFGNRQVSNTLGTSFKTVESHRRIIMHKLGLCSTADLVREAVRNGLIQP
jgi:DNA-binding NarL/FixJ family response regulator